MGKRLEMVLVVVLGLCGLAACGGDDNTTSGDSAGEEAAAPAPGEEVLVDPLDDDSEGWGVFDGEPGRSFYDEGELVWENRQHDVTPRFTPDALAVPVDAGDLDLTDVIVRAEGRVVSGDASIGVYCREGVDGDGDAELEWYEFVARDGFTTIRRVDSERNIEVLAESDDVQLPAGDPVVIAGTCVDEGDDEARLTLSLDDELLLDTVVEGPLPNGAPGLLAYDVPTAEDLTTVRWAEFSVHHPAA